MSGGEAPKLDQPRLALVQLQTKAREPLAKLGPEPLGLATILKAHHEVIREPRHDDIAASVPRTPLVDPQVEHVMEVNVREQRRNRRPLRRALQRLRPLPVFDDPRLQPSLDQAKDPLIRDPVLEKLQKPRMIEAREAVADVRVEHRVHLLARDPDRQSVQRLMRGTPRPEPVRETEKVLLIYGVQHLDHRPLQDLVLQRSDPERP